MLSHLSEPLDVDFDGFFQSRHCKVPFVSQPIAPTARLDMRVEFPSHHFADRAFVGGAVEIEVIAQVRIVIEGLHHCSRTISAFQFLTDVLQVDQSG